MICKNNPNCVGPDCEGCKNEKSRLDIPVQSSDLLCRDCFYWDKGTCRRYPPQNKWMRQPGMDPKDWCGEHKPKGGIMKNKPVGRNPHGKSGPHKIGNAELPPKKQISNTPPLKKRRET